MPARSIDRSVRSTIARLGLSHRKPGRAPRPQPALLESKRQLAALYRKLGSTTRVARHLHCEQTAVRDALDRLGIPRRPYIKYDDRAWFVEALRRGLTVRSMAAELGSQQGSAYRVLDRHGLPGQIPYRGGADLVIAPNARASPTDGTRMVAALASKELGEAVNRKRVQRIMRIRRLLQPSRATNRRRRPGFFRFTRPDELWHFENDQGVDSAAWVDLSPRRR